MNFRQMVKTAGLLWERQGVLAPVVFDRDIALFNVDIWRSVFAHGAELDQMGIRAVSLHSEQ